MNPKPIRVRIAPSPTGNCHVGTARTALYNYLFAKQTGGTFILRVDDTDSLRNTLESEQGVFEGLRWIGLSWDEGPDVGGAYGPYRQSERLGIYAERAHELLEKDLAYECFCSPEDLEAERKQQMARKEDPHYGGHCANLTAAERETLRAKGIKPSIRLRVRPGTVGFDDSIRGRVEQDAGIMGDFVIIKSNGIPVYNFGTVIDEYEMQISHVIRGAEHISNTFPQVLIYEAFGWEMPVFAHLVLMLNPDKTKISKRKGAVYLGDFAAMGYLPEALLNFCAFLGWTPGGISEEILSLTELQEMFSLQRCTQSNAVFDQVKLDWMNGMWIRRLSAAELTSRVMPFMIDAGLINVPVKSDEIRLEALLELIHERLPRLDEAPETLAYFYTDWPAEEVDLDLLTASKSNRTKEDIYSVLQESIKLLRSNSFTAAALEEQFKALAASLEWKLGDLLMPLRVAVTNRKISPPLFTTMEVLGLEKVSQRLANASAALLGNAPADRSGHE
ncbi:MAG: glutamate--tRNA ligase [Symbiobacteriaceae bacterium]|nr:glutamate--tRNA ligase [Symbiobacteriaceae bacterium]